MLVGHRSGGHLAHHYDPDKARAIFKKSIVKCVVRRLTMGDPRPCTYLIDVIPGLGVIAVP